MAQRPRAYYRERYSSLTPRGVAEQHNTCSESGDDTPTTDHSSSFDEGGIAQNEEDTTPVAASAASPIAALSDTVIVMVPSLDIFDEPALYCAPSDEFVPPRPDWFPVTSEDSNDGVDDVGISEGEFSVGGGDLFPVPDDFFFGETMISHTGQWVGQLEAFATGPSAATTQTARAAPRNYSQSTNLGAASKSSEEELFEQFTNGFDD